MTRDFANRIGGPVITGTDGGIFNTLQQYNLNIDNDWVNTGTIPTSLPSNASSYIASGYKHIVFTGNGFFYVTGGSILVDYFIVAGGGAGGSYDTFDATGGGGAGGVTSGSIMLSRSTYGVRVGPGGTFNTGPTSRKDSISQPGNPSFITGSPECKYLVAYGGGSGGSFSNPPQRTAQQGGSGGGGGETSTTGGYGNRDNSKSGSLPEYQRDLHTQGYPGASGGPNAGGGGGGAGGPGQTRQVSPFKAGDGGIGVAYPFSYTALPSNIGRTNPDPPDNVPANARWFAGGGGGGAATSDDTDVGVGGIGGGGDGGYNDPNTPSPGRSGGTNTGGGGGGTGYPNQGGGNGGPGIVIIRFPW